MDRTHLQPKRCALADCRQLRRLKVCESQRGQVAILTRERGKAVDHNSELLEDEGESGADEDEVRVATMEDQKGEQLHCVDRAHSVT
jgi:hypothetical protein